MPNCILVTGATGFLGPWVVERLMLYGLAHIRCLIRPSSDISRLEALRRRYPQTTLEYVEGSLASDASLTDALAGVSHVFHLAAGMRGRPADMYLNTVVGSKRLLQALTSNSEPVRVVLVSSFSVYGVADLPRNAKIDENTPLETHPEKRDVYAQTKLRQELLFREWQPSNNSETVVVRPGVIHGPGGGAFSVRVGLQLPGVFLHLGGNNQLPLSYVENCAEAIVIAGMHPDSAGQVYNVHDDQLLSARQYLSAYRRSVKNIRRVRVPYWVTRRLSGLIEHYHLKSRGQIPAVLTPYRTASAWKPQRFDNSKLKQLGWRQLVPTEEALRRTFEYLAGNVNRVAEI